MSAIASRFGPAIAVVAAAPASSRWVLTIVLHGLEIQANKIGEEKVILGEVPCPVTNLHGIRVVGGGAGRRHVVQRRHGGGRPTGLPDSLAKRPGIRSVSLNECMAEFDPRPTTWRKNKQKQPGKSNGLCRARNFQIRLEWKEVGSDRRGMEKQLGQGMASRHRKVESWHRRASWSDGICLVVVLVVVVGQTTHQQLEQANTSG